MIAEDTPLWYLDETAFSATDVDRWRDTVIAASLTVIQCPGMCRFVHEFGDRDDLAVVLVRRDVSDIIASQRRIGWRYEQLELANYEAEEGPVAKVKYDYWDEHQRDVIQNAYEVEYESLAGHPLWVPKDRRRFFAPKQWFVKGQELRHGRKEEL
jgi:hypothetical protein